MCGRAARNYSSVVFIITVFVLFMAATCTAAQENNSTQNGNNNTSDQVSSGEIIAIVGVVIAFLSLIVAIVGIILGIKWCKNKNKTCLKTQSKGIEQNDLGNRSCCSGAEGQSSAAAGQSKPKGGKLQKVISDKDIVAVARDLISNWETLATYLGTNHTQKKNIRDSFPNDVERQARECLQKWKTKNGNRATYQALISAAEEAQDQTLADGVKTKL